MLGLFAVGILGLLVQHSAAQNTAKCLTGFDWSFNSLGQSPCDVAAALGGVCIGTSFSLGPLSPGLIYLGPTPSQANSCRCSSVYYSLLSACATCQDANFLKWSTYKTNCSVVYSQVFPQPIPSGVTVPHYAYLDVETADTFNPLLAQTAGGPESTSVPQSTSNSVTGTGFAPTNSAPTDQISNGGKKSNAGAIAGGVVGGVIGLALIAGLVFWLLRRKQKSSSPSSVYEPAMANQGPMASQNPMSVTGSSYPSTPAPKVYDPNDPSTYPTDLPQTGGFIPYNSSGFASSAEHNNQPYSTNISPNFTGNSAQNSIVQPSRPQYTGAPEL